MASRVRAAQQGDGTVTDFKFYSYVFGGLFVAMAFGGMLVPKDPEKIAHDKVVTAQKAEEEREWKRNPCHNWDLPRTGNEDCSSGGVPRWTDAGTAQDHAELHGADPVTAIIIRAR
jgi:hypothetical protein